jgi:CRISPR system Cascade subunit CasB
MKTDSAVRAALKRSLDGTAEHRRAIYPYLLPLLGDVEPYQQEPFLLVAALYALYPTPLKREHSKRFGRSCARLAHAVNSEGPERRFKALLDTDAPDLAVPLAALVRLMKSKSVDVDYDTLLRDLRQWNYPDKWVQDRWAREFWAPSFPIASSEPTLA